MTVLKMIDQDMFQVFSPKGSLTGDLKEVMTFSVYELGIEFVELEVAVDEMLKHDHNGAEFGVLNKFLFTFSTFEHKRAQEVLN